MERARGSSRTSGSITGLPGGCVRASQWLGKASNGSGVERWRRAGAEQPAERCYGGREEVVRGNATASASTGPTLGDRVQQRVEVALHHFLIPAREEK